MMPEEQKPYERVPMTKKQRKQKEKPESVPSCGDGWISVKDRLPEEGTDVLTFTPEWDGIGVLKYSRQYGTNILGFMYEDLAHIYGDTAYDATKWVTHWQPLPKAPTKH